MPRKPHSSARTYLFRADSGLTSALLPQYACIQQYGDCAICTPDGDAKIRACYEATCGNPPTGQNPYAGVYYGSICPDGGYQDYTTTPPHFVTIPPSNCTS
ncbi:MAG: hypothetical protein L6R39_005635 [Caloplaca ligustica]|nr:MAG: hypothetical protein L6R39_005635 [Caloplaca ligustica]